MTVFHSSHSIKYFNTSDEITNLNLELRPIKFLLKNNYKNLFKGNEKCVYLFVDDYFIREHYFRGTFLKSINAWDEIEDITI